MSQINPETTPLHTLNPLKRFSDRAEDYVKYRPSYPAESRMQSVDPLLVTPYFINIREYTFTYRQQLDLTGLIGRAMSVSYLPREGLGSEQLIDRFQELYQRFHDESGLVYMVYRTSVHLAKNNDKLQVKQQTIH